MRKDGFDGAIDLEMTDLPPGVTAAGLKIPAGKTVGRILISAAEDAPRSLGTAKIAGRAEIGGAMVTRPCRLASMVWPVKDASQEIPVPRLLADVPVSVSRAEGAPITVEPAEARVWEATEGEKLTIPLKVTWRSEFAGASIKLSPIGPGFESAKEIDIPLKAAGSEAVIDLAALKTPPGDYTLAFIGSAVAKYRYHPEAVPRAEEEQKTAEQAASAAAATAQKLAAEASAAPTERKAAADAAAKAAGEALKVAEAAKQEAARRLQAATAAAAPKDVVEIVTSAPIRLKVTPRGKS